MNLCCVYLNGKRHNKQMVNPFPIHTDRNYLLPLFFSGYVFIILHSLLFITRLCTHFLVLAIKNIESTTHGLLAVYTGEKQQNYFIVPIIVIAFMFLNNKSNNIRCFRLYNWIFSLAGTSRIYTHNTWIVLWWCMLYGKRGILCVCERQRKKIHKNNGMKKGMNGNIIFKGALFFPWYHFLCLRLLYLSKKMYKEWKEKYIKILF